MIIFARVVVEWLMVTITVSFSNEYNWIECASQKVVYICAIYYL